MIKFHYNLTYYNIVKVIRKIKRVVDLDKEKLQNAINNFQVELDWNDMWTVEDAQKRLKDGWYFNILEIDDEIVGWVWFNSIKNELCNLYVHKDYRKCGYGTQLIYSIMNLSKNIEVNIICAKVDEWNTNSQNIFNKCNWEI